MKLEALFGALGTTVSTTLLAVAATGCAADSDTDPMTMDPGDTVAPAIVSTTPAHDSKGAAAGTKIQITFSESMDPATVIAGYASEKLPLDKVSMQWNADQTVLTISPDAQLLYADGFGNDPTTQPRLTYSITIGADATDLVGNPLGTAYDLRFSTKVRMATTAAYVDTLTATTLDGVTIGGGSVVMGDAQSDMPYRGYVTFGLGALPQGISIESAAFSARQTGMHGTPYASLGPLKAYHLSFSTMTGVNGVAALSTIGTFSEDGNTESKSIDVTAQLADDIANRPARGNYSQYRLQFDTVSANGEYDRAIFATATFEMSLVYIAD